MDIGRTTAPHRILASIGHSSTFAFAGCQHVVRIRRLHDSTKENLPNRGSLAGLRQSAAPPPGVGSAALSAATRSAAEVRPAAGRVSITSRLPLRDRPRPRGGRCAG